MKNVLLLAGCIAVWAPEHLAAAVPANQTASSSGTSTAQTAPGTGSAPVRGAARRRLSATPAHLQPNPNTQPPPPPVDPAVELPGLTTVDSKLWDETAVRKVLLTFAYGGQTTDRQIRAWANMDPRTAITEIMRWDEHNPKLSVPSPKDVDNLSNVPNNLTSLARHWSREDDSNPMPGARRWMFSENNWEHTRLSWTQAVVSRGLNPFRDRIGFFETNYHLAVSMKGGAVTAAQMRTYYDTIVAKLASNAPYQDVLAEAALSAAVTRNYGHNANVYWEGDCQCNEDFAREYHQLFFGVLGLSEKAYHEQVNIKNTALVFTDIDTYNPADPGARWAGTESRFGSRFHYPVPIEVHHQMLPSGTTDTQIRALSQIEIGLPDSLNNLPVMIIHGIADDNLDNKEMQALRVAWRSMPQKDLLHFLRAYAISTQFHSPNRVKYQTSFDRHISVANLVTQSNEEQYIDAPDLGRLYSVDQEIVFNPDWGVFGAQAGQDAADSDALFRANYNAVVRDYRYTRADRTLFGRPYHLDWSSMVPANATVASTAAWLWQRFTADGLKNFGPLERAYMYALLATGRDFPAMAFPAEPDKAVTLLDVQSPAAEALIAGWGNQAMPLDSADAGQRTAANERVGQAAAFIIASPYIYAQEGR